MSVCKKSPAVRRLSAGLTAAMAEALKLQKMRMMMGFHGNSDQHRHRNGAESDNDETGTAETCDITRRVASSPLLLTWCPRFLVSSPVGGSEGSWEKEQRLLPPHSSGVAPPPLSASHRLNTLQQHSSLLANRESQLSDWIPDRC